MYSILLAIIYLAFISLGLPDSLLGSAWPVMYKELNVPMSFAGIITMIIAGGTIVSSLFSDRLTRKLGAGMVTAISVLMTAVALFGFSISDSIVLLCLWAIPYGLGAGAVDAALNNYVALHYTSRHMSWLHCFWGVGVAISPYIMGYSLTGGLGWNNGYRIVSIIQIVLTAMLFLTLPLWKRKEADTVSGDVKPAALGLREAVKLRGVKFVLVTFFCYCAVESTAGLWASSYLVGHRGIGAETAAKFAALFYMGITVGRFLSGFVADRLGDKTLIRIGIVVMSGGAVLVGLPFSGNTAALFGLVLIGFGGAPIYPSIIHATPFHFGKENSQSIVGIQMACAYVGSTFIPPIFGLLAENVDIGLYPFYLLIFAVLMFFTSEKLNGVIALREKGENNGEKGME